MLIHLHKQATTTPKVRAAWSMSSYVRIVIAGARAGEGWVGSHTPTLTLS